MQGRPWKNIYPTLKWWMEREGRDPEWLGLVLYLNTMQVRNRLCGRTEFARLEQERLAELTGIPRKMLFRKEEK